VTLPDPPDGRLLLAFRPDQTLDFTPTWTRIDSHPSLVTSYTIDRGRQLEMDRTDTGRATVQIADTDGILDPTNPDGPYFGQIEPLIQAMIGRRNPINGTWYTRFRGWVEELDYSFDPSQRVNRLTISLVDIFEILAAIEMQPGQFGDVPPADAESAGMVFFDNAIPQGRIWQVLGNAGIPEDFYVIFSGNVLLYEQSYSPGESVMTVIQESADGEFPGSASNVYTDRFGRLEFHGRFAKFDPEGTQASEGDDGGRWDFIRWKAGDKAAVNADPVGTAQLRQFGFNRGLAHVINNATATPDRDLTATQIAGQLVQDTTSSGLRGIRSWSAQALLTKEGLIDSSNDLVETKKFATYYVDNYATPVNRATLCGFRSIHTAQQGATKTWELMSKIDIGDAIAITVDSPGGGGFNEGFFVEGIHEQVNPLNPDMDDVTLTLDLSPVAAYQSNPFVGTAPDAATDAGDGSDGSTTGTATPPPPGSAPGDPGDDWIEDQPFTWNGPEFTVPRHTWVTIPFTNPVFSRDSNVTGVGTVWTNIPWDDPDSAGWIDPSTPRVLTIPHDMRVHDGVNWLQIYLRLEHPMVEPDSYRGLRVFETTHQKPIIQAFVFRADAGGGVGGVNVYIGDGSTDEVFASGDTAGLESGLHDGMMVMPDANVGWLWCGDWLPKDSLERAILKKGMRLVPQVWHDASVPLTFDCSGVAPYRPHFVFDTFADRAWGKPWSDWPTYS
jgi:hypothetical protein